TVFVLRDVEGLDVAETAACLDVPAATVKTRLHRARSLLRARLGAALGMAAGDAFAFAGPRCDRTVAAGLARIRAAGGGGPAPQRSRRRRPGRPRPARCIRIARARRATTERGRGGGGRDGPRRARGRRTRDPGTRGPGTRRVPRPAGAPAADREAR